MTAIDLVVTDLDGTLWEHPDHTPARTLEAVAEVESRGIPLLVATGRRLGSTRRPLEAIGLRPPAVMLNGSLGVQLASDERFHLGGIASMRGFLFKGVGDRAPRRPESGSTADPGSDAIGGDLFARVRASVCPPVRLTHRARCCAVPVQLC